MRWKGVCWLCVKLLRKHTKNVGRQKKDVNRRNENAKKKDFIIIKLPRAIL